MTTRRPCPASWVWASALDGLGAGPGGGAGNAAGVAAGALGGLVAGPGGGAGNAADVAALGGRGGLGPIDGAGLDGSLPSSASSSSTVVMTTQEGRGAANIVSWASAIALSAAATIRMFAEPLPCGTTIGASPGRLRLGAASICMCPEEVNSGGKLAIAASPGRLRLGAHERMGAARTGAQCTPSLRRLEPRTPIARRMAICLTRRWQKRVRRERNAQTGAQCTPSTASPGRLRLGAHERMGTDGSAMHTVQSRASDRPTLVKARPHAERFSKKRCHVGRLLPNLQ